MTNLRNFRHCSFVLSALGFLSSCNSVEPLDISHIEGSQSQIAYSTVYSRSEAIGYFNDCLDTLSQGEWREERTDLFSSIVNPNNNRWTQFILIESIGTAYLTYQYKFVGLTKESARLTIKDWRHKTKRLDRSLAGSDLQKARVMFSKIQDYVTSPWIPVDESLNMHPACFFITLKLRENLYRYAVFDPVFRSPNLPPPLLIMKRVHEQFED